MWGEGAEGEPGPWVRREQERSSVRTLAEGFKALHRGGGVRCLWSEEKKKQLAEDGFDPSTSEFLFKELLREVSATSHALWRSQRGEVGE